VRRPEAPEQPARVVYVHDPYDGTGLELLDERGTLRARLVSALMSVRRRSSSLGPMVPFAQRWASTRTAQDG